jgi:uncharacterized protein (TIGR02001 family)
MLKKMLRAGAVLAVVGSGLAQAQQPAAPASPHTITGNVGLYSQYIFRGLTKTDRDPAIQGGLDYAHSSGFYLGTWASNISWLKENFSVPGASAGTYGSGGSLEWDFYGGYKMSFGDFGVDIGTLYYWYPGKIQPAFAALAPPFNDVPKANTWELYLGGNWKWISAKLSYSLMDETFGVRKSDGTFYVDVSANVPLGDFAKELTGITLIAHWGYQKYRGTDPRNVAFAAAYGGATPSNDTLFTYKDVKLGVSYALPKDFTVGAYYTKAYDANILGYGGVFQAGPGGLPGPFPRNIAKGTGTAYVQKTF